MKSTSSIICIIYPPLSIVNIREHLFKSTTKWHYLKIRIKQISSAGLWRSTQAARLHEEADRRCHLQGVGAYACRPC